MGARGRSASRCFISIILECWNSRTLEKSMSDGPMESIPRARSEARHVGHGHAGDRLGAARSKGIGRCEGSIAIMIPQNQNLVFSLGHPIQIEVSYLCHRTFRSLHPRHSSPIGEMPLSPVEGPSSAFGGLRAQVAGSVNPARKGSFNRPVLFILGQQQ